MQNLPFAKLEWFLKWCSFWEVWTICQLPPFGEVTGEEELSTLHTHFKNNHPVLTPENKVIFCLNVRVVSSNFDYTQKHFEYKPMTQILSWVVANNFWASNTTWYFDCKTHIKLSLKNQHVGFVNAFSNTKGFPCGSAGQESACNGGDLGSIPGLGRSPGEGKGYPLQYSSQENSMDCIIHGVAKSWTWLSNFHSNIKDCY